MNEPTILLEAEFNPKVKTYWIWQTVIALSILIVTIPLAIIYYFVANYFLDKYLKNMSCVLTDRTLDIKKGIWNKTESTIPLEKITDLQLFQGPIMRHFELHGFKVETAGQSSPTGGALVNIVGIKDTKEFRMAVLAQRDRLASPSISDAPPVIQSSIPAQIGSDTESIGLLTEIRDILRGIESQINEKSG